MTTIPRHLSALAAWSVILNATAGAALTGKVIQPDGAPVAGITVLQKSTNLSATTDASGNWTIASTTGVDVSSAKAVARTRNGRVELELPLGGPVELTVRDVRGQILARQAMQLGAGHWSLAVGSGAGVRLVEIRAPGLQQVLRSVGPVDGMAGNFGTEREGSAARALASDTLTLKEGTNVIGKVGIAMTAGTAPEVKIVKRTLSGRMPKGDTALSATRGSIKLLLVPSVGASRTLTASYDATARTFVSSEPWALYQPTLSWKVLARAFDGAGAVIGSAPVVAFRDSVSQVALDTFSLLPDALKPSVDWVWPNRIQSTTQANALNFYNSLFDQIMDRKGTLNVCLRWESDTKVTQAQRVKFEPMLNRAFASWNRWLKGYDGYPHDSLKVKVVGWALLSADKLDQTGLGSEVNVYVNGARELVNGSWVSGAQAPRCPDACNRQTYKGNQGKVTETAYPGCTDTPFEISLWGTDEFQGGAGGDWGSRTGSDYLLSVLDAAEPHIVEHEFGHGFLLPDFYETADLPPTGLPAAIMQAGASAVVTPWDGWMLRRTWSELRAQGRWTLP